jgi:hypothetical protein
LLTLDSTGAGNALTIPFSLNAGTGSVMVESAGAISQTAGAITAATLAGSSVGSATFGQSGNNITALGAFSTSNGNFTLVDAQTSNLSIGGTLNAGTGSVSLTTTAAGITEATGGIVDPGSLAISSAGPVTMANANTVDTLAASITGAGNGLVFNNTANPLTVGAVSGISGITTNNGNVALTVTTSGGLTIVNAIGAGSGAVTAASVGNLALSATVSGGPIVLATNGNFTNTAGASALSPTGGNSWLVYSTNPASDNDGGLTPAFIQYAATYNIGALTGTTPAVSGNGLLYSLAPTITVSSVTKVYDGTVALPTGVSAYTFGGAINNDSVTINPSGASGVYASQNVGANIGVTLNGITVSASNNGIPVFGYGLAAANGGNIGTITPATLRAGLTGTVSKVFDGTTTATLAAANYTLSGVVGSDSVSLNNPTAGTYASANVGTGIKISVSGLTISGASAGNYVLASNLANAAIGTITPATLTASITGNPVKIYDGTTTAPLGSNNFTLSGFVASQGATIAGLSGTYATANAGSGIGVSANLVTGNFIANAVTVLSNYTLPTSASGIGTIAPRPLTVTADDQLRPFGQPNPPLTYTVTSGSLIDGGVLSGMLATTANGNSLGGLYPITQGTLAAPPNYALTFVNGVLMVTPLPSFEVSPAKYLPPVSELSSAPTGLTPCSPGDLAATLAYSGSVVIFGAPSWTCGGNL